MWQKKCVYRWFGCVFVTLFSVTVVYASDLSNFLFGGAGSRTTVADPYIPPPFMPETPSYPTTDGTGTIILPSNLMFGTPGATTLPPGGVVTSNGVATTDFGSANYVIPAGQRLHRLFHQHK